MTGLAVTLTGMVIVLLLIDIHRTLRQILAEMQEEEIQ